MAQALKKNLEEVEGLSTSDSKPGQSQHSLKYRPDIDGLRAIAVLFVVIYHAFPTLIPGGFVGVDIFFVISGYLISAIIYREMDERRFSLKSFYQRRILRIFPALAVVTILTTLYAVFIFLQPEFKDYGRHLSASCLFFQNFVLRKESGYFDLASHEKPLLHLWSLSVEEQFYIFFPLFLMLFWRRQKVLVALSLIGFFASLATSILFTVGHKNTVFYMPVSRGWEFLAGSFLAYFQCKNYFSENIYKNKLLIGLLSTFGAMLILYAGFFFSQADPYPHWRAIIPTLGAVLIIFSAHSFINKHIMGHRVMVGIGLLSYPWYLWHWPILSFAFLTGYFGNNYVKLAILIATLGLSYLTYRFIEKPIRFGQNKNYWTKILVVSISLLAATGLLIKKEIIPSRLNDQLASNIIEASRVWDYPDKNFKDINYSGYTFNKRLGTIRDEVLFVGDSNMQQYYPRISWLMADGNKKTYTVTFATYGGVAPIPSYFNPAQPGGNGYIDAALRYAKENPVKKIVIAAQWLGYLSPIDGDNSKNLLSSLEKMIQSLKDEGKKVILILTIPMHANFAASNLMHRTVTGSFIFKEELISLDQVKTHEREQVNSKLSEIAVRQKIEFIDPADYIFTKNPLHPIKSGVPIYKDISHLSSKFVRENLEFLDDFVVIK